MREQENGSDIKDQVVLPEAGTPFLHPAPGRCIVKIVPRLLGNVRPDENSGLITAEGIELAIDSRRENQPMVGTLLAIGDPTNEREKRIADWAIERASAGDLFVFSQFSGSPYWNDDMKSMISAGYDFRWLQRLRLFDMGQLGATISGCGEYGEAPTRRLVVVQ